MTDHSARFTQGCRTANGPLGTGSPVASIATGSPVASLAARRDRTANVVESVTFILKGEHCGTFPVKLPYAEGAPFRLYVSTHGAGHGGADGAFSGTVDFLITDVAIGDDLHAASAADAKAQ